MISSSSSAKPVVRVASSKPLRFLQSFFTIISCDLVLWFAVLDERKTSASPVRFVGALRTMLCARAIENVPLVRRRRGICTPIE